MLVKISNVSAIRFMAPMPPPMVPAVEKPSSHGSGDVRDAGPVIEGQNAGDWAMRILAHQDQITWPPPPWISTLRDASVASSANSPALNLVESQALRPASSARAAHLATEVRVGDRTYSVKAISIESPSPRALADLRFDVEFVDQALAAAKPESHARIR